ncbi:MAG: prepilin peptidase [Polyangiaceae bacterium]
MTEAMLRFGPTLCLLAIAAYFDLKSGLIPNRISVAGFCVLLPMQLIGQAYLSRQGFASMPTLLATSAAGLLVCSVAPLALYFANGMGGGDVKLLAVLGALAGPAVGIEVELYSFLLIALYALIKLAYHGRLLSMFASTLGLTRNAFLPKERRKPIPSELLTSLRFAPAVLVAMLLISSLEIWAP